MTICPFVLFTSLSVHQRKNENNNVEIKDTSESNSESNTAVVKSNLDCIDCDTVCTANDVDKSYDLFINKFNSLFLECFPEAEKT